VNDGRKKAREWLGLLQSSKIAYKMVGFAQQPWKVVLME